jgi:DNA end-binding protein Ku
MPRAIWSGAISFGLVNIPVKLYSAVSRKTVRFHQLDREDNQRIQQKRVNPRTGEEVPYENLVKGYELAPDRYVVITPEELDGLEPQKTKTIDIEDFVDLSEIDPIYYDHPYYLVPDKGAEKAYKLLLEAMKESGKVAIARVVIRSKENLVAIRPLDGVLTMETMLFGDEVVPPDGIEDIPSSDGKAKTSAREVEMARQLIDSLTAEFDPDKYRDEYRDRVLDMIERKADGQDVVVEVQEEEPQKVPDLMAALEASIKGAKRQGGTAAKKPAASNGAKSRSGSSKKKTAKK